MTRKQIECNEQRAKNRASVQRYRGKHRRIDYVPAAAALKIIEGWLAKGLSNCNAGVIDHLVEVGHRAMSGNCGDRKP